MNKTVKKLLILIGVIAVFVVFCMLLGLRDVETFEDKYAGHDLTADAEGAVREGTYTRYLNAHADAARPQAEVALDLFSYTAEGGVEVYSDYEGAAKSLFTDTKSMVTWEWKFPRRASTMWYWIIWCLSPGAWRRNEPFISMENCLLTT